MLKDNGSFQGPQTGDSVSAWNEADLSDAVSMGLLALIITTLILRPRAPLLRFLRAVLLTTLFLQRHQLLGLIRRTTFPSVYTYTAIVLSIQYAFAGVMASSGSESPPSGKGTGPTFPPRIFPSHTTHTRFFPSRHSFKYSYLLVGIPIGWRQDAGLLSCDPVTTSSSRAWFSVHAEDYLARGSCQGGLRAKLDNFLRQHGVDPTGFPHAYLVTAPRFLGWSFNPVSFWYLYDEWRLLKAMILEVNNTFDERRMYLLQLSGSGTDERFRMKWQKDFHVSPFNDREGDYSLLAIDPFAIEVGHEPLPAGAGPGVDNTITLSSPEPDARPKLVARVHSVTESFDPRRLSYFQKATFMARWCWTGFLTNPRILREARLLWTRRKLPVFFRPEVNVGSIGRQEISEETVLERGFIEWLQRAATRNCLRIGYNSAAGTTRGQRVVLDANGTRQPSHEAEQCDFDLEILTPEWYSELARASDVRAVFEQRCFIPAAGERMAVVSESGQYTLTEILRSRLISQRRPSMSANPITVAVNRLRLGTSIAVTLLSVISAQIVRRPTTDNRKQVIFDDLVNNLKLPAGVSKRDMQRAALTILLADRLSLGFVGLFKMYGKILWYVLVYATAASLSRAL